MSWSCRLGGSIDAKRPRGPDSIRDTTPQPRKIDLCMRSASQAATTEFLDSQSRREYDTLQGIHHGCVRSLAARGRRNRLVERVSRYTGFQSSNKKTGMNMQSRQAFRGTPSLLNRMIAVAGIAVVVLTCSGASGAAAVDANKPVEWKASIATVVITPDQPMWMAGYAARNKPPEGKVHDLHAKALALEDASNPNSAGISPPVTAERRTFAVAAGRCREC